ncbi:hypothetical protein Rsub_10712 [Raphidocelis subcapitata]|uniref:Transcription initiation factor IIE subunit alpha N-terminal domain-containing protein n=1 Tax=Raphidocelis subcapitata TaxID=307507 RepID=A0A2V0PGS5_9CHLO|nr:hypothetical protein Rsub_10712 [Raphidocelis subcapitata]|eukprot:GBF98212.1 hypothetical protein Rsub_10712 [Raphidocelis subcapitata]
MATTVVPTSFKVLVKMVASAFYGGMCPPLEAVPPEERERAQKPQNDTTGLGRVLLAALTERQWVKEDELASDLNLQPKMARRALRGQREGARTLDATALEQLLQREHRRETKRQIKKEAAALDQAIDPEDEEALRAHVVSYCALDYPRLLDALRYRLETMTRNVRRACENREVVQRYRCTNDMCAAEFRSLDVDKLEMNFEAGVGYTGNTAERRAYVARMQEINKVLESQLKPLRDQLAVCVGQQVPDFNTFQVWMTERIIITANEKDMREKAARSGGEFGGGGGYGGYHGGGGGGPGISIDTYDANMQTQLAAQKAAAAAVGKQVAVPWLQSKFAAPPGGAAAGGGEVKEEEGSGAGADGGVKPEPDAAATGRVKPEPGEAWAAAAAAAEEAEEEAAAEEAALADEGADGGGSPPHKRRRGLGEGLREVPVSELDWVGDAQDLVGGAAAAGAGGGAAAAGGAPPPQPSAGGAGAAAAWQQQPVQQQPSQPSKQQQPSQQPPQQPPSQQQPSKQQPSQPPSQQQQQAEEEDDEEWEDV